MPDWISALYSRIEKPYKIFFLISFATSVIGGAGTLLFGWDKNVIFAAVLIILALGLIYLACTEGIRARRNKKARLQSPNPQIKILDDDVTLDFSNPKYVLYERKLIVRSAGERCSSMSLFLEWNGDLCDCCIDAQVGCEIFIKENQEGSGCFVNVNFVRDVSTKYDYSFAFRLGFDNSKNLIKPFIHKIYSSIAEKRLKQTVILNEAQPGRFSHTTFVAHNSQQVLQETYQDGVVISTFVVTKPDQRRSYRIALTR